MAAVGGMAGRLRSGGKCIIALPGDKRPGISGEADWLAARSTATIADTAQHVRQGGSFCFHDAFQRFSALWSSSARHAVSPPHGPALKRSPP
jgi:hypothetical protein